MMNMNSDAKAAFLSNDGSSVKSCYAIFRFYAEKNGGRDTIRQNAPTSYVSTA